jgi:hypothetical protein
MRARVCGVLLLLVAMMASAVAQTTDDFSRKNTFTLFAEGSAPSTPLVVGSARRRLLFDAGGGYTRRLLRFWGSDLGYHIELRPILFESDPLTLDYQTVTYTSLNPPSSFTISGLYPYVGAECKPGTFTYTSPPSGTQQGITQTDQITCGRQWTFGQSFAPIGFKYSTRTHHRAQPFLIGTLGYMYTSRPVPAADAESFNFVINVGAGVEVYRAGKRSVSLETRVQHFSNRDTAAANPGTDNLMFKASYSFGR